MNGLKSILAPLRWLVRLVLALVILFELWGWEPLKRAAAWVARLPLLRRLEGVLTGLPPYAALGVLILPSLLLLPLKLLALWLFAQGHPALGLAVVIGAKLAGTAVLAWLFQLIQPALMRLVWFAKLYGRWLGWKAELLAWIRASFAWRAARGLKRQARLLGRKVRTHLSGASL